MLKIIIPVILTGLISYFPFSLAGEYKLSNYGGQDWRTEWHPRFMMEQYRWPGVRIKTRYTIIGVMYWPCIFIDRKFWHQTEYMEPFHEQIRKMQ